MPIILDPMLRHRTEALALVTLTRVPEVIPTKVSFEHLDFLCVIKSDDDEEMKKVQLLGVNVKGTARLGSEERATSWGSKAMKLEGIGERVYYFPVIVLLFSMEDDKGYYAWQVEPATRDDDSPILHQNASFEFREFTVAALKTIIRKVRMWYKEVGYEIVS